MATVHWRPGRIYTHFEKLAASEVRPLAVTTDKVVVGGATLKRLWEMQDAVKASTPAHSRRRIAGYIPETNVTYLHQYAQIFVNEVT